MTAIKLKPLEYTLEYASNYAEFTYEASNVQPFETILDTFDYKDTIETEWRSKYYEHISYNHEPYCLESFMKHRRLEFKSEEHIKFFLYLLGKHLNNIKQAQVSYNTEEIKKS